MRVKMSELNILVNLVEIFIKMSLERWKNVKSNFYLLINWVKIKIKWKKLFYIAQTKNVEEAYDMRDYSLEINKSGELSIAST